MKWSKLDYWKSGEWQVVMEKLNDLRRRNRGHSPERKKLFEVLRVTPFDTVRVALIGQDPYPNPNHATGIAFGVPNSTEPLPASLVNIFSELKSDVGYDVPPDPSLVNWCKQGVLLWNAYPSCEVGKPGSHHWSEWELLTKEIVEKLDEANVVFVLLGRHAQSCERYIKHEGRTIRTSHPSPLGVNHGFAGSRIFSRTNQLLVDLGKEPIDWRL